jgi:adenosylcobinamide-phosphate synthase
MRLEYQVLSAVALDLCLGDPHWLPHPVRGIGWLAARLETLARPVAADGYPRARARLAGLLVALTVYVVTGLAAWGAIYAAGLAHPAAGDAVAVLVIYAAIAPHDLARHGMAVYRALAGGDLVEARRRVAAIVGRDTEALDLSGVVRAAVESVAESTVDGVTAPLLFAVAAGPVGAIVYRAINTLDSMFGHQDPQYRDFGWAAARIDDLANYLPARLTAPLLCVAAALLGRRPLAALRILVRDGRKHPSPNAGLVEAAVAGALGVQLGGRNFYAGLPLDRPTQGDPRVPLASRHIPAAVALMFTTAVLLLAIILPLRGLAP